MTMKTIGITGATGFLGTYLVGYLAARGGCHLRAIDRIIRTDLVTRWPSVAWMRGDLASERDCLDFAQDLDVILHLAHTNTPLTSDRHLPSDAALNLVPTLTLLEVVRRLQNKPHVIYPSSGGAVYGRATQRRPFRESDPCRPVTSYGIQKLAAEHYLRLAAGQGWLRATCLRIGNPYGVLLPTERRQGLIGVVLNQIAHDQPVTLIGNPANVRDFLHLDDLGRLVGRVLDCSHPFEVFNVGSGRGHSVRAILRLLERIHGRPIRLARSPAEEGADHLVPWVVLDISKSRRRLGWRPGISLAEGLRRLYDTSVAAPGRDS